MNDFSEYETCGDFCKYAINFIVNYPVISMYNIILFRDCEEGKIVYFQLTAVE